MNLLPRDDTFFQLFGEKEADLLGRPLLMNLFGSERDPITLLKHKELFEALEAITDRCDDVANVLENVSVKNA